MPVDGPIHPQVAALGAADLGEFVRGVLLPLAILLVIVVAGWFGIRWIGKWSKSDESDRVPFSLEDLRRLRREGALSEEEFERAKEQRLSAAKRPSPRSARAPEGGASKEDAADPPTQVRPVPPAQLRQRHRPSEGSS